MGDTGGGCPHGDGGGAGKRLFTAVCRLRRTVALANPLLDFDRIICTLEQPGDYRFAEQARASRHGHFAGGGPLLIENFKTQPRLVEPLADVTVSATTSSDASLMPGPARSSRGSSPDWT